MTEAHWIATREALPQVGQCIARRYLLERLAGQGTSGVVFRARDRRSAETVAIKLWFPWRADASRQCAFEADALRAVNHFCIARHRDHGATEDGVAFLVMDWIEGPTLAERLAGSGLRPLESLQLARRLSTALGALHASGVVHRDLKPANVILRAGRVSQACVMDLGIARVRGSRRRAIDDASVGTPRYMAPEQIFDPATVSGAADVFALGCILYECLTGEPAYGASDTYGVAAQILFAPTPSLCTRREALPGELEAVLAQLLARSPEQRPGAGARLNATFRALARGAVGRRLERLDPPRRALTSVASAVTAVVTVPGAPKQREAL